MFHSLFIRLINKFYNRHFSQRKRPVSVSCQFLYPVLTHKFISNSSVYVQLLSSDTNLHKLNMLTTVKDEIIKIKIQDYVVHIPQEQTTCSHRQKN